MASYISSTSTHEGNFSSFSSLEPPTQPDLKVTSNTKSPVHFRIPPRSGPSIQILMGLNLAHISLSQCELMINTRLLGEFMSCQIVLDPQNRAVNVSIYQFCVTLLANKSSPHFDMF